MHGRANRRQDLACNIHGKTNLSKTSPCRKSIFNSSISIHSQLKSPFEIPTSCLVEVILSASLLGSRGFPQLGPHQVHQVKGDKVVAAIAHWSGLENGFKKCWKAKRRLKLTGESPANGRGKRVFQASLVIVITECQSPRVFEKQN